MALCQMPTTEYADFAQLCGLPLGLTSVVYVPGLRTGDRLSHSPECVPQRPAHPAVNPIDSSRAGSSISKGSTVRLQPPLHFCSPSPWLSTCREFSFRGLIWGSCQAMAPQVTWRPRVMLWFSSHPWSSSGQRAHPGRQVWDPSPAQTTSKSIRRAVSRALVILLTLYLCHLSKGAGPGHRVSVSLGYSIRWNLSTLCNTACRRRKPVQGQVEPWKQESWEMEQSVSPNLLMATRLPSRPGSTAKWAQSGAPAIGGSYPSLSRWVQACPVSPENRQEGRARLTRHKKYLDGLKTRMFVIIQLSWWRWGCW